MSNPDEDNALGRHPLAWPSWLLLVIVGATVYEVIARYLFNAPTIWANELSIFLCSIVFLAAGVFVMHRDEHLRITILYDLAPPRLRRALDIANLICVLLFCGAIAWFGFPSSWRALKNWELYGTAWNPPIPAVLKPLVVLAAAIMAVQAIINFVRNFKAQRKHDRSLDQGVS
jgi:TRAP-type C4-dicarboxylate transport system permease small subunit